MLIASRNTVCLSVLTAMVFSPILPCARGQTSVTLPPFSIGTQWITSRSPSLESELSKKTTSPALPIFRQEFAAEKAVVRATLTISGLGQYEAHINGHEITNSLLTPSWSDYRKKVFYDRYDVTRFVAAGKNAIGIMLGNGMYNVSSTEGRYTKFEGSFGPLKLIAELHLYLADNTEQIIGTANTWKTAPGFITFSSIYGGEDEDARLEQAGWDLPNFNDAGWSSAIVTEGPGGHFAADIIPPVQAFDRYDPIKITHPKSGISVYDLGQNFSGWPEIQVVGHAGDSVKLTPGELLDAKGLVTQRSAAASPQAENSFTYILRSSGPETWHPRFSYYGFRYIQVQTSGNGIPTVTHLDGRFLHDAVKVDGSFSSSDELFNRIHLLINRAMLSNLFSVITDCPHREKLGWLEQTHLAAASLMYNFDLSSLYAKIIADMDDAQLANGLIPDIAPEYAEFSGPFRDSPEWGAAVILSPWAAYQFDGDLNILRQQVAPMERYVAYLDGRAQGHLLTHGLGDWYDIGPQAPGKSQLTGAGLTATATYYQCLTTLVRISKLLGDNEHAEQYARESELVYAAFNRRFFNSVTNQYDTGSQTANAMPLVVGLVPDKKRNAVLANLISDIRDHSDHVTAGDIGFHYVVRALTDGGRSDVLYDMLSRTDKPSYGDQLAHGATTLTEAWDANANSSQNHFMLGHAEEWFYRGLAGIDIDMSRDFDSRIILHPAIVGTLKSAAATFSSKLGPISSSWVRDGDTLHFDVVVPADVSATLIFPVDFNSLINLDGHPLQPSKFVRNVRTLPIGITCIVSGGTYHFEMKHSSLRR